MTPSTSQAWRALVESASAPYRNGGRFAWHFARGKLLWDPVFKHLMASGLIAPGAHVLDIGCGQGLLASLLGAADAQSRSGHWPVGWAAAPSANRVTGIEIVPREAACARRALGANATIVCGDMRRVAFPAADTIVILDALHYVSLTEQDDVLARARAALGAAGCLVIRVGDTASRRGFAASRWVDRIVAYVRGFQPPRAGRPLAEWRARLAGLGFDVASRPMHRGTPFANVLLVGKLDALQAAT